MLELDEKAPPMPARPRLRLNGVELVPVRDMDFTIVPNLWAAPGMKTITTTDAVKRAKASGGSCELILV